MRAPIAIEPLRAHLLAALHHCQDIATERIRVRILRAASAQELWLERSDLF